MKQETLDFIEKYDVLELFDSSIDYIDSLSNNSCSTSPETYEWYNKQMDELKRQKKEVEELINE